MTMVSHEDLEKGIVLSSSTVAAERQIALKVAKRKKHIYLTFDDGPHPVTSELIGILEANDMRATFFIMVDSYASYDAKSVGFTMKGHAWTSVEKMLNGGHAIGSHGRDHDPVTLKYIVDKPGAYTYQEDEARDRGHHILQAKRKKPHGVTETVNLDQVFTTLSPVDQARRRQPVRDDFAYNETVIRDLFASKKRSFDGFVGARLPGDGRNSPYHVSMLVTGAAPERGAKPMHHVGWNFEFAPNGTFPRREYQGSVMQPGEDRIHDLVRDWNGVTGVAGTGTPKTQPWPKDGDIVLLHDHHWTEKKAVFKSLIEKLKKHYDSDETAEWLFISLNAIRSVTPKRDYDPRKKDYMPPLVVDSGNTPDDERPEAGWFVQIKGKCSRDEADQTTKEAQGAGYDHLMTKKAADDTYRVLVGPYDSADEAREAAKKLADIFPDAFIKKEEE